MIRLRSVNKAFAPAAGGPAVDALVGFDLEVGGGEIVAILGPSGSGKTTVLKLVAGFERADAGVVEVNGAPVTTISPQRVLVQQDSALFPGSTWRTILASGSARRGERTARRLASGYAVWVWLAPSAAIQRSCRVGCGSASRWHGRSQCAQRCCCWTSHSARWTRSPVIQCRMCWRRRGRSRARA